MSLHRVLLCTKVSIARMRSHKTALSYVANQSFLSSVHSYRFSYITGVNRKNNHIASLILMALYNTALLKVDYY